MPYIKTVWADEIPSSSPIKYKITDDSAGILANSAKIELVTSVTAGTPINATNLNKLEAAIEAAVANAEAAIAAAAAAQIASRIPVGWIIESTTSTNPATTLGYGTWESYGAGRVTVGVGTSDRAFVLGEEDGASEHTLISAEMPSHTHTQNAHNHTQDPHNHSVAATPATNAGGSTGDRSTPTSTFTGTTTATNQAATATNQNTGGDGAHNNLQPYIVVHRWRRTA